jgi:hypothetical protein
MLAGQAPPEVLAPERRGRQAADARLRIGVDLARVRAEVEVIAADPELSRMLDVGRLRSCLQRTEWWTADQDPDDIGTTMLWLTRSLTTAAFVQYARDQEAARIPAVQTVDLRLTVPVELREAGSADRPRGAP